MKKKISLFLIVFLATVSAMFIYNSYKLVKEKNKIKKELKDTNEMYDANIQYNIKLEDSIANFQNLVQKLLAKDKFSLNGNPKAQNYLQAINPDKNWNKYITDKLMATNQKQQGDNKLIPFAGMAGAMQIDRIKVLNNRWIIAHFTDGTYQGEMLLQFFVNKNGSVDFKVLDSTLFQ